MSTVNGAVGSSRVIPGAPYLLSLQCRRTQQRISRRSTHRLNVHVGENGPSVADEPSRRKRTPVELPRPPAEVGAIGSEREMFEFGGPRQQYVAKDAQELVDVDQGSPQQNPQEGAEDQKESIAQQGEELRPEGKIMREVLSVALPALGTVLADPLMSLVDTACVGQLSSVELAALGPNTAIFNFVFQLFTFLGLSTANFIASKSISSEGLSSREVQERRERSESIICFALTLATVIGLGSAALLYAAGPMLLRALGSSADIIPFALPYLRIRALASPAVMITLVAQGACLGQQDMWTPLKVVFVSGLINLFGDMHLILNMKMGTVGAALATTASQYAGALFFLYYLRKGGNKGEGLKLRWKGLPTMDALKPLFDVGQVLLARTGATMIGYTAITSGATVLGTLAVAAHQVTLQVFWLLAYFPEPFSLTAQTLIAKHKSDRSHVRRMAHLLLRLGTYTGVSLALVLGGVLSATPFLFSSDPAVISTFQSLIPQAMLSLLICSTAIMCDGINIGSGQIEHMPVVTTLSMLTTVTWVYCSQLSGSGLGTVWWGMVAFFVARLLFNSVYIRMNWATSPFGLYRRKDQGQQQQQVDLDPALNQQLA